MAAPQVCDVASPGKVEILLSNDAMPHLEAHVRANAKRKLPTVPTTPIGAGKTLVLCGSGPSLQHHIAAYAPKADELWACNRSLTWLRAQGHKPTHAISVDPTKEMVDDWDPYPDVQYYVASIAHPKLFKELQRKGRRVQIFHTLAGMQAPTGWDATAHGVDYETFLYKTLFPGTWRVDHGLNICNRATCLALVLGFEKIYVLGADCALVPSADPMPEDGSPRAAWSAWLGQQQMYPWQHGTKLWGTPTMLEGWIDGRRWVTRVDMAISAHCFYIMQHTVGAKLELIGDTLPNAIMHKSPEEVRSFFPAPNGNGGVGNMVLRGAVI